MMESYIKLGNAYELIKDLPDNSVDLVYTDIPYLFHSGSGGTSPLAKRINKNDKELKDKKLDNGIDQKGQAHLDLFQNS